MTRRERQLESVAPQTDERLAALQCAPQATGALTIFIERRVRWLFNKISGGDD